MGRHWGPVLLLTVVVLCCSSADGAEPAPAEAGLKLFETKIRPLLVQHCYPCHSSSAGKAEGELRVDAKAPLRQGGNRGPAVVPGDPAASWLLTAASHADPDLKMPPKAERLSNAELADLKEWIRLGAVDPRENDPTSVKAKSDFWAKRPLAPVMAPTVKNNDWPIGPIDPFVLAKLENSNLKPSPDATSTTLLRRVHFDLTGLPPPPANVEQFQQDVEADGLGKSLERIVDGLLATPQFGEHWGRHWLDVARFAESSGKEANITFPYAWRYRDYVIDGVTADVPFDRFLQEQIAGDLLPADSDVERARLLIATSFLALGPKNLDEGNQAQFAADLIDEQIDAVTRAVLANSVACARCHDHKFDPFTREDYYGLAGIFASTKTYFGTAVSPANRVGGDPLTLPAGSGLPILHASIPAAKVDELKAKLAALRQEETDGQAAVRTAIAEGRDASMIFTLRDALRIFWTSGQIEGQLERVSATGAALPLTMGVQDRDAIVDSPLYERGDVNRPKGAVPRAMPTALRLSSNETMPTDQSGRFQLARWLTHPDHPITARVFVNRVWHHLFGAGLVRTVDNFGSTGEHPSHPELLDDLATRFMSDGWSLKRLVRTLVLSRTYRQSSTFRPDAFEQDPDNRLLWRMSKRRLPAEAIRDAMLVAAGELNASRPTGSLVGKVIGDGPVSLIGLNPKLPKDLDGSLHRSVYLPVIRDRLPDVLELFDFAEPSLVTGEREATNVPTQALFLLNSPFVTQRSLALARRLTTQAATLDAQIRLAYQLCLGREPLAAEVDRVQRFLQTPPDAGSAGKFDQWTTFCQALLATAEFRNLD